MKIDMYELFAPETETQGRRESVENVRTRTLGKIEQAKTPHRAMRPLGKLLLAAAIIAVLVGGAFAAPAIWNALTGVNAVQAGKAAVILNEDSVSARSGYLEITPQITANPDAPEQIETYYVPANAADWTPEQLYYSTEEAPTFIRDFCGGWTLPDGNWLILRQCTLGSYSPDAVFDTVNLGFDDQYTVEQRDYDSMNVQCIVVPPSQAAQDMAQTDEANHLYNVIRVDRSNCFFGGEAGVDLQKLTDSGRKKLYWSDGDYLFTLEVSYAMSDEMLADILNSLTPVQDVAPYVSLAKADAATVEHDAVISPLFPAYVPEGWTLSERSGLQGDGSYTWIWSKDDMSGLELLQTKDASCYDLMLLDWKSSMTDVQSDETSLGNWTVKSFESEWSAALLWQAEGEVFYLSSDGSDRLSAHELLQIAASLAPPDVP